MNEKWWKELIREFENMSDTEWAEFLRSVHVGDEYYHPEYPYEEMKHEDSN